MPYLLRYDGTNDTVSIPAVTLPSSFEIEIDFTYYATSGVQMFFSGWTTANNDKWYVGTSNNVLYWFIGGTSSTGGATLVNATRYKIKFIRSGSNFSLQVNGSTTATRNQASVLQAFDRIGSSNESQFFAKIDFYTLSYTDTATPANNRLYDANLSGGSGTTLPTLSGTNQGTLNNFTVPACWIFYSSGASNAITVSATLPKITGSLTLNEINPSYVISVNGQLPKITGAVTLNEINPVFTVAVAGQLPRLTGSIALNQFANNRQAAVNGVLPKLTGSVTLNRIQPNNQVSVSGQLPRITASITLRATDSYPTANPNDYTVSAYLSTDSAYTVRLSESSTINAIISASSTFNARLN